MTTPRDDIAGLIERLRDRTSLHAFKQLTFKHSYDYEAGRELLDEAATQLDALQARVKELEGERNVQMLRALKAADRALRAQQERDEAYERAAKYEHALTPSAETKCAYIGEFKFFIDTIQHDDDGEEVFLAENVTVPWDTVKQIMAAIRRLAGPEKDRTP